MSFFKRFRSPKTTDQISELDKPCEEHGLTSPAIVTPSSGPPGDEGLSLFSGMTFSSVSSSPPRSSDLTAEGYHEYTQHTPTASQELEEAGLNLDFKGVVLGKESVCSTGDNTEATELEKNQLKTQTSALVMSGHQGKKKKKTQAKRPGYARDATASLKPQKASPKKPVIPVTSAKTSVDETKAIHTEPSTPKVEKEQEIPFSVSSTEETKQSLYVHVADKAEEKCLEEGVEENVPKREFHPLYSLDTPSSSEENLADDITEEQEAVESRKILQEETRACSDNGKGNGNWEVKDEYSLDVFELSHQPTTDLPVEIRDEEDSHVAKDDDDDDNDDALSIQSQNSNTCGENEEENEEKKQNNYYDLDLDAEDKGAIVEEDMRFRISALRDDENILKDLEKDLIQRYSNSSRTFSEKQRELDNLVHEETNALASDNYDLAEELNVRIEEVKDDLEKAKYKLPAVDIKVQEALELRSGLADRALSVYREAQVKLEELREVQASILDAFSEENNVTVSKEKQQLNAERQRLDRACAHLELDTEHLEKEETILDDEILQRTQEFVHRKESFTEEREQIKDEIKEVEKTLAQLRVKETQCVDKIEAEELKIRETMEEFSPQKDLLNDQRDELDQQRKLLDNDQESLALTQEKLSKTIDVWSNKKQRLTGFLDGLGTSINNNDSSIGLLEKQRGQMEDFQCIKHLSFTVDSSLDKLKSSAKQTSHQIKSLESKINLSQRNIAALRKRLSEIEAQISERNEAKDIAKKERNFKEAKRLKEEIEALNAEGIDGQEKLENIVEELNLDQSLLLTTEKDFEKITEELKEREYESDLKLVNSATQVIQVLQNQLNRYVENELLHTLLAAEISTCQNLQNELCTKHGISPPTLEEPRPEDSVPDDDVNEADLDQNPSNDTQTTCEMPCVEVKENNEELLSQLAELEGKLEAVVELEDFDEADRLQQDIIKLKTRLEPNKLTN